MVVFVPGFTSLAKQSRRTSIYICDRNYSHHSIGSCVAVRVPRATSRDIPYANHILDRISDSMSQIQYVDAPIVPLYITNVVIEGMTVRAAITPWFVNGNVLKFVRNNPRADRLRLTRDLASAICFLHSQGIVIGNVHPGNFMVRDDGDGGMLMDVGMARFDDEFFAGSAARTPESWAYKPADELHRGGMRTQAMDVYSFATTTHAIYTGRIPTPPGRTIHQCLYQILQHGHDHLVKPDGMRERVWSVLRRCLEHHDPTRRPSMSHCLGRIQA